LRAAAQLQKLGERVSGKGIGKSVSEAEKKWTRGASRRGSTEKIREGVLKLEDVLKN